MKKKLAAIFVALVAATAILYVDSDHSFFLPMIYKQEKYPLWGVELEGTFLKQFNLYPGGEFIKFSTHWNPHNLQAGINEISDKVNGFGGEVLLNVKGYYCEPPEYSQWQSYVYFSATVIALVHPFAFEVWNEPDTDVGAMGADGSFFGCWGSSYASGQHYAEFYNFVYSQLKPRFPNTVFLAGALSNKADFFDGMMAGLVDTDGISFHCHVPSKLVGCDWIITYYSQRTSHSLYLTESSVICNDFCNPDDLYCWVIPCINHDQRQVTQFDILKTDGRIELATWYQESWMNARMLEPVFLDYVDWIEN